MLHIQLNIKIILEGLLKRRIKIDLRILFRNPFSLIIPCILHPEYLIKS